MGEVIVSMKNITKTFPGVKALDNVNFELRSGEVMALLGENGAGKSTLMKILSGVYTRDSGTMEIFGTEYGDLTPKKAREIGVAIIHQELNMCRHLTVTENMFLGREKAGRLTLKESEMEAEARRILGDLKIDLDPRQTVGDLPVSKQQMVEIAKALSVNAKILIMDEPTSSLTAKEIDELFRIIRQLKAEGRGIVYISHRLEELQAIVDRVTIMRDGQYIMDSDFKDLTMDKIIANMVGREIKEQFPRVTCEKGEKVFEVRNLNAGRLVRDINFSLYEGEIVGFAGLMGAGRTELMKVLYGALPRSSGSVTLDGREVVTRSPQDGLANGIVYISEDRKRDGLVLGMSVKENMSLTALRYFSRAGGSLKHKDEQQAVSDFIRLFNVKTPSMEQAIGLLSGGNQQKVAIARGLMTRPKVLILDEPTRGVDVGAKKEIYQLINQFKADGLSIILVSSEMPEVLGMSDRIIVMHEGHLGGEFTREQATQEVLMAAAVGKLNRVNQE